MCEDKDNNSPVLYSCSQTFLVRKCSSSQRKMLCLRVTADKSASSVKECFICEEDSSEYTSPIITLSTWQLRLAAHCLKCSAVHRLARWRSVGQWFLERIYNCCYFLLNVCVCQCLHSCQSNCVCSVSSLRLGQLSTQLPWPVSSGGLLLYKQVMYYLSCVAKTMWTLTSLPLFGRSCFACNGIFHSNISMHKERFRVFVLSAEMCCPSRCSYQMLSPKLQHTGSWRPSHTWDKVRWLRTSHPFKIKLTVGSLLCLLSILIIATSKSLASWHQIAMFHSLSATSLEGNNVSQQHFWPDNPLKVGNSNSGVMLQ